MIYMSLIYVFLLVGPAIAAISGLVMSHWLAIFTIPSAVLEAIGLLFSWILQQQRSRTTGETPTAFYRSRRHKVIAGVCSALAQRWHQSLPLMRIVAVVLAIVTPGFIFLYLWCWLAFPIEPRSQQLLQPLGEQSCIDATIGKVLATPKPPLRDS